MRAAVLATAVPQLDIAPSTMDLSGLELEIGQQRDRAFRLRNALGELNKGTRAYDFTYVLVDCPPSLNLLTVNAMAAANSILVPLQCEFFALEGLSQLLKTVDQVKNSLNPTLSIHGIVLTMYNSRNNLSNQVVADVRQFMGAQGLRHGDPAQRAHLGGAVLRQAGAGLRFEMRRQRSLLAPRHRDHPAREGIEGGVIDRHARGLTRAATPGWRSAMLSPPGSPGQARPCRKEQERSETKRQRQAWHEVQERRRWRIIRDWDAASHR